MKRLFKPLVPLLAFVAVGCGVGPHVDDYNEALVASGLASCACSANETQCRADVPPNEAEQACLEALFKNTSGDFEAHLDCRAAAHTRYASCLNSKSCTDLARIECPLQLADELEDCPDFPSEVQQEHDQCLN